MEHWECIQLFEPVRDSLVHKIIELDFMIKLVEKNETTKIYRYAIEGLVSVLTIIIVNFFNRNKNNG